MVILANEQNKAEGVGTVVGILERYLGGKHKK